MTDAAHVPVLLDRVAFAPRRVRHGRIEGRARHSQATMYRINPRRLRSCGNTVREQQLAGPADIGIIGIRSLSAQEFGAGFFIVASSRIIDGVVIECREQQGVAIVRRGFCRNPGNHRAEVTGAVPDAMRFAPTPRQIGRDIRWSIATATHEHFTALGKNPTRQLHLR